MAKKSVTPSLRMSEEEYLKLKALKEKYNVSWESSLNMQTKCLHI